MSRIHGFTVVDEFPLEEYRAHGVWARHDRTGCELFHLRNDDHENLFSFIFKTLPTNSTGVAHILEHAVLCGSQRFPVKDPFVLLMRGSLNTFVNAMTYPDKTMYPASSTVAQDLFNIMKVYGDAVFNPLLKPEFFRQEGHRLAVTPDGQLDLTGIVYNEMKGNYANHDSLVAEWSLRSLLPDTPYSHDSGGDPAEIPDLTYADFAAFHRDNYHPSSARVFVYGNIPTETYMSFLDSEFLSGFEGTQSSVQIPRQSRWTEPREMIVPCPADEDGGGPTTVTLSWLLDDVTDPYRILSLELLAEILLGTSAAPLRRSLIESGLGDDLSAATGLESETFQMAFSVGLRGTKADQKTDVESLVLGELERLVREGLNPDIVEAAFRKVEFRNREMRGGPNGLRMLGRSIRGWLHGERPDATLRFQEPFARLKDQARPGSRYFESLIEQNFLRNPHRSTVVVVPDAELRERERSQLREKLAAIDASMTDDERARILADQEVLAELQRKPDPPEAVATIPFLTTADLPTEVENVPTGRISGPDGVPIYTHDVFSNGIVYVDLAFDVTGIERNLLPLLPFYAGTLGEVGLPGKSADEVATEVALKTGGMSAYVDAAASMGAPERATRRVFVRVKVLESGIGDALDLLGDLLLRPTLDNTDRLDELWRERKSEISGAILPAGSGFASLRAGRALSDADRYEEEWQGITQLQFLQRDYPDLSLAMMSLNDQTVRRGNVVANVTGGEAGIRAALPLVVSLIEALPAGGSARPSDLVVPASFPSAEALIVPTDVAYVAAAMPASRFGTGEHVHELILAHLLRTGHLWETIRMQGGAYGASAYARGIDAVFGFSSYRDPRIVETIAAFGDGLALYAGAAVDSNDMELAQIGVTGHDIRPLSPGQKGLVALRRALYGISDQMRQAKRDFILSATPGDVRRAAERLRDTMENAHIAVLAGDDAVRSAAGVYPALAENQVVVPV